MSELIIQDVAIHCDEAGRYCLNDLHRAAGGEKRHQPSNWLILQKTIELVKELEIPGIPGIQPVAAKQGLGTFVVRELVYSYAMWISPAFHLKVIRTFDSLQKGLSEAELFLRSAQLFLEQVEQ